MKKSFNLKTAQVLKNCIEFIGRLDLGKWEVHIKPISKTSPQRNYWHACMQEIAEVTGTDEDDIKFGIKKAVLGLREWMDYPEGKIYLREVSSEGLDKQTYGRLIDATFSLAEQMDVKLPEPEYFGYEGMMR